MAARFPKKTKGKTAENEQGNEWERGEERFRDWKEAEEREREREREREKERDTIVTKNACASNPATHLKARWRGWPAGQLDISKHIDISISMSNI